MRHLAPLLLLAGTACHVAPRTLDLSQEPFPEAVSQAIDHLELAYSFTEHKQLDWDAARADLEARAAQADTPQAQAEVIRRFVPVLPDAHVLLFNDDPSLDLCPQIAATTGVALADLDDGRVIIAHPGASDLQAGDVVERWGGLPIVEARAQVPFHCWPVGAATHERIAQVQLRLLVRAPAGGSVPVQVLRGGESVQATLSALVDTQDIREALEIQPPERMVEHERLPDGTAYVRIGWEETYLAETRFHRALTELRDAPALVIDLRDNDGGMDMPAANIAGTFTQERFFYETITFLSYRDYEQEVISDLWVEPQDLYWDRPTAVLIDGETVSSGEGLAFLLSQMPQVRVFGLEGTAASFGSTGSGIAFPGGWTLSFPGGRSLDQDGNIQLDSDHTLQGGVHPTEPMMRDADTMIRFHAGEDVVLEQALEWLGEEVSR